MSDHTVARMRRIIATVLVCTITVVVVCAVMNRQLIQDQFAAASFDASSPIEELKDSLQLTDEGELIFLASHPTLDGSQNFNTQCAELVHETAGHVLGCYIKNRIHLFNVTDQRVAGIVEVTAAHELLHAAFSRMRPGDRTVLTEKLRDFYQERSQQDPDLAERMQMYADLPDAAFASELHSVLGSEQADLPDWLEKHYSQWFTDRNSIVETYRNYRNVFQGLENESRGLREHMQTLRTDVEQRKADYDAAVAQYESDLETFERRVAKREFTRDPKGQAAQVKTFEERRDELNNTLEGLQDDIDQYNEYRASLEQLGELSSELEQQLDSALAPVTTRPSQ